MSEDGSDGSPPRPVRRKIKKVMVLSSASESDSDESVAVGSTRRKRMRVLSDDGASSSGSSVVRGRRRALPALRDSDADSDSSGWASDAPPAPAAPPASGFASDSSEGNSDKCSICLLRFKDQEVGTPQTCEHIFCLDCITEWSKNVNTCPVDRITFNSIVVRACAGGRVLRTEPVKVVERRPSVDILVVEDPTPCEICGSTDNEETMLLCDGCDLGFHMQCLTPPLTEVPIDQWLCPNCDDLMEVIHLSELHDLFDEITDLDLPNGPRSVPLRMPRNVRRSARNSVADEPSTSSGIRASSSTTGAPSTSRTNSTSRSSRSSNSRATTRRRTTGTQRRKYKRRTKTVVIEYEVEENGKFPVTKTIKRRLKKRKTRKRQPRTAARRSYVRASVRAKLAGMRDARAEAAATLAAAGSSDLSVHRHRAGIPALSLFGSAHDLDYFSEEEHDVTEGAAAAVSVAIRPNYSIFSTYRQARRKMLSIPSPPHAASAPDILSSIMESQTLLHSKRAVVSVTGTDGKLDIKLDRRDPRPKDTPAAEPTPAATSTEPQRVDVRGGGGGAARQAPAYGGGRAAGGWGGGYRGGRVPPASPAAPPPHHAPPPHAAPMGPRRGPDPSQDYAPHYAPDVPPYLRGRRPPENGRPPPFRRQEQPPGRHSAGPGWPPYGPPGPQRHSYGGGPPDDPIDMRTASTGPPPAPFGPLPEPPAFKFDGTPDRSEDEENSGLVIDTEKYDPMEPTNDDESGDETPETQTPAPPAAPAPPSPPPAAVRTALAGLDAAAINVPPNVLDSAVRQVLAEHRDLMAAPQDRSDDDSDGDCPNFSIYSATSVHIASNTGLAVTAPSAARTVEDQYKEKVSKRCPITTNPRNPIKIKLNAPSLIKRQVSLYDEEEADAGAEPESEEPVPPAKDQKKAPSGDAPGKDDEAPEATAVTADDDDERRSKEESGDNEKDATPEVKDASPKNDIEKKDEVPDDVPAVQEEEEEEEEEHPGTPETPDIPDTPEAAPSVTEEDGADDAAPAEPGDRPDRSPDEALEKMTESISETEDERSYTPCLDENKSKDTSLETDKEKGIEGLDTEMISEEEGNDMFSEEEARAPSAGGSPARPDDDRKRRRRDARKEGKEKKTKGKKGDVAFKKLSKSGKERNYRDKDKERGKRERRDSADAADRKQKRKEKRKDLERYDVRTVVTEKRKRVKDAFGRDVSPPSPAHSSSSRRRRSGSPRRKSLSPRRKSISPRRKSISPRRKSISPRRKSISPRRRSITPRRRSISLRRRSITPRKRSISPRRRSITPRKRSISPRRRSVTPRRKSVSPRRKSLSPKRKSPSPRRRSASRGRKSSPTRRRRSGSRGRKRRRSASHSPKPKTKKKKRPPSRRRSARRNKSPKRKRAKRSRTPTPASARAQPVAGAWSPSIASCLLSPRTPPAPRRHRRDPLRTKPGGPCKEVFTSGDNILVSVSFKDQERDRDVGEKRKRREAKRDKRRKRRRAAAAAADVETAKPIAIIDLERSPFREITPSPKNVIVLSDSDQGDKENERAHAPPPAPEPEHHVGPKTPPEPEAAAGAGPQRDAERPEAEARGPSTPPESPDAYDPFEPTASPDPAPAAAVAPEPPHITLEAAQKTNLSADDVIDRRPISPIEKVMALLQSTRDVSPEPPPGDACLPPSEPPAPAAGAGPGPGPASLAVAPSPAPPRIVLPSPTRSQPPKLFLAKPSPIKSNPVKPMQATKISRLPLPVPRRDEADHDSPYSPGSSDFGDLFEPPGGGGCGSANGKGGKRDNFDSLFDKPSKGRKNKSSAAKVPVKLNKKKGNKTQVGVKIDEDNLKILDDLPSSAVEMQVKSKFLKKLNRQERVVEEVKMVLKPHYNKKHVTKDEYKDILRRCVPKICHNKSGEINPTKIQALVEAYVKKFRKKHKLGIV